MQHGAGADGIVMYLTVSPPSPSPASAPRCCANTPRPSSLVSLLLSGIHATRVTNACMHAHNSEMRRGEKEEERRERERAIGRDETRTRKARLCTNATFSLCMTERGLTRRSCSLYIFSSKSMPEVARCMELTNSSVAAPPVSGTILCFSSARSSPEEMRFPPFCNTTWKVEYLGGRPSMSRICTTMLKRTTSWRRLRLLEFGHPMASMRPQGLFEGGARLEPPFLFFY
jgi:hypothetical protein